MARKHATDEHPENYLFICADCAPRPDPAVQQHPLPWYVGRHVKQAFRSGDAVEHMWVRVTAVSGAHLTGVLANRPILVNDVLKLHDVIDVWRHDIEAVEA
jgi:Uncharacterized protein conserved in bacteria (DUF2314)